jgi:hypothetical protein
MSLPFFSRWLAASGWRVSRTERVSSFGRRGRSQALAAARLEFAEALFDVHTAGAAEALDRIAVARSLHELWHLREDVFSRIARHRDQAEAERRLADLDRHFPRRTRVAAFMAGAAADGATVPGP